MNRSLKVTVAAIALTCSVAYAKAGYVSLPVKVNKSDLIAKVEILSTTQVVPLRTKLHLGEYRSKAEVKVIQSIKGLKAGEVFTLEFDNGFICPNVWYKKGDECLVFNTKMQNGDYETFNTYFGKYMVKENKVVGWQQNSDQATAFDDVANEITKIMETPKKPD